MTRLSKALDILLRQGRKGSAIAAAAQSAETNEDLAQSEGRQSGGEAASPQHGRPKGVA